MTGLLDLHRWPKGMRVIIRSERPHPGAQLRITDIDGNRITAFATNTARGSSPTSSCGTAAAPAPKTGSGGSKDTGLTNLPLHSLAQNAIWCAIVALAVELTAWLQMLALAGRQASRWEPKKLRLRVFSTAGGLTRSGRRTTLQLPVRDAWTELIMTAVTTLRSTRHRTRLSRVHPSRPAHSDPPGPVETGEPSALGGTVTPTMQNPRSTTIKAQRLGQPIKDPG